MPRPTQPRRSLPSHAKAAATARRSTIQDDDLIALSAGNELMRPRQTQRGREATWTPFNGTTTTGDDGEQTKATKQHLKRQALLDKITSSQHPYSKSHARRIKRASKPEHHLVSDLKQVEKALPLTATRGDARLGMDEEDERMEREEAKGGVPGLKGGKGKEKLTAKKRSRVLESEASRLPAVLTDKHFKKDAFAAIRLHMMNQIKAEKEISSR